MTSCNLQQPIFIAATEFTFKDTKDGFLTEAFLISDRLNANNWMVTAEANRLDGQDFVGKPDIVFLNDKGERDHTTGDTLQKSLDAQEPFRKGTMLTVKGTDTGRKLTTVSKITDKDTQRRIKSREIRFVSPAIFPRSLEDVEVVQTGPNTHIHIVHRYHALHRAYVDEPAYNTIEATIGATCEGNVKDCLVKLQQKQAGIGDDEIGPLRTIPIVVKKCSETGNLIIEMEASELTEEVSKCLSQKLKPGEDPTDQDLAICFSEAREKLKKTKAVTAALQSKKLQILAKQTTGKMGNEDVTKDRLKELESQLHDMEDDIKKALKGQTETEEEKDKAKKAQEKEDEDKQSKAKAKAKRSQEEEMTEDEKKDAKAAQEKEKEKEAQEKEEELTSKIASVLAEKIPLVETYVAAKVAQKGLDQKAAKELREKMLKASVQEIQEKLDDIGSYVAIQKSQNQNQSEIGYYPQDVSYTASTTDLENKLTEELLEELEA